MSKVSEIIKRLHARGLTQAEIKRRTGIPQPRLSRWGAGSVPAGAEDALKLAHLDAALAAAEALPARTAEAA